MIRWEIQFKNSLFSNLAKLFLKLNKKVAMLEEYYIPENCDNANCIC